MYLASLRRDRSLTLLHVFLVASAAILLAGGVALGSILTRALRSQAVDDAKVGLTQYVNGVVAPRLVSGEGVAVTRGTHGLLEQELAGRPDVVSVKVWRRDGVLAWTNLAPERIGRAFPVSAHLREALAGEADAHLEELDEVENAVERHATSDRLLEVYAPVRNAFGGVVGAYEIYADASPLATAIGARKREIWLAVAAVFATLWAALALLVRGASRALRRRNEDLAESYRLLEESSLQAIQGLNATVDAKDPYTAGHSQRVQRICLAVAGELGLSDKRLDAVRQGGLLHDIGKLRVPDAILTKPGPLTDDEYAVIKRHPGDGAAIVAKLGALRHAVPVVRHHHERWDGRGYPDGLAGDEIPLEAAVAGLADAWDAMTTDRPYRKGLSLEEALAEVRAGRGTQFAPAVVDAFLVAYERSPEEFAPNSAPTLYAVAS